MKPSRILPGALAGVALATLAHAQVSPRALAFLPEGEFELVASAGFTAAGDADVNGAKTGELETSRYRFAGVYERPVFDAWSVEVGALFDRLDIDANDPLIPLSDRLDSVALVLGASWKINEAWMIKADAAPGLYGDAEVDSSDAFTVPAVIAARWNYSPSLTITFGVSVQPFADSAVMPVLGVRWQIAPDWRLTVGAPQTELAYRLNDRVSLSGGLALQGGAYAVDDPNVSAPAGRDLRDTRLEVSEIRGFGAVRYKLTERLSLRVEAGYAFERTFDYYDRGVEVEADAAAFGAISLTSSF